MLAQNFTYQCIPHLGPIRSDVLDCGSGLFPGTRNFGHLSDVAGIVPVLPEAYTIFQPTSDVSGVLTIVPCSTYVSKPNTSGDNCVDLGVDICAAGP